MAESTPFLATADTNTAGSDLTFNSPPTANPPASKAIVRLTNVSFFGSMATLVVLLAAYIISAFSPLYTWQVETAIGGMAFFLALAALLSFLNRTSIRSSKSTPLTVNIVFDLVLTFAVIIWTLRAIASALQDLNSQQCGRGYNQPAGGHRICTRWLIVTASTLGAGVLGGVIVGVSHLTLFVLRCTNAWCSRFWSRPFPWFVSAGQGTIEFTVRVAIPERERARGQEVEDVNQSPRLEGRTEDERLVEV